MTKCECAGPGFCQRHGCCKTVHFYRLCKNDERYFRMWEEGRGPNQDIVDCKSTIRPEPQLTDGIMEDDSELPNMLQQAKNFGKAVWQHITTGAKHVSQLVYKRRLEICATNQCGFYLKNSARCAHGGCGCYLETKAAWDDQECPLELWKKDPEIIKLQEQEKTEE